MTRKCPYAAGKLSEYDVTKGSGQEQFKNEIVTNNTMALSMMHIQMHVGLHS